MVQHLSISFDINRRTDKHTAILPLYKDSSNFIYFLFRISSYKHIVHNQMVGEFDSPAFHQQAQDYR